MAVRNVLVCQLSNKDYRDVLRMNMVAEENLLLWPVDSAGIIIKQIEDVQGCPISECYGITAVMQDNAPISLADMSEMLSFTLSTKRPAFAGNVFKAHFTQEFLNELYLQFAEDCTEFIEQRED